MILPKDAQMGCVVSQNIENCHRSADGVCGFTKILKVLPRIDGVDGFLISD